MAPSATPKEIKHAYLKLAKVYHPDVATDPNSRQNFQQIQQAYETLSSPAKRAVYDANGYREFTGEGGAHPFSNAQEARAFFVRLLRQSSGGSLVRPCLRLLVLWTGVAFVVTAPVYVIWSVIFGALRAVVRAVGWVLGLKVVSCEESSKGDLFSFPVVAENGRGGSCCGKLGFLDR